MNMGTTLAMGEGVSGQIFLVGGLIIGAVLLALLVYVVSRYRRCPSNRILVIYGKVGGNKASRCIHGGGVFVVPLFQDYQYLSLEPITIEIDLTSALSLQNIRVNVPSTFTIGISTRPEIMNNAAERLLGLNEQDIARQANDIIFGQLRLVIATLPIEEINQDREKFLVLVTKNVGFELNKIGLEVINVNIRDITDESGYIEAIGKKAAAEAINQAKIEVAMAMRTGEIGQSSANREREIEVARQVSQAEAGKKQAERDRRVAVAKFEADGLAGEADAQRLQEVAIAEQAAKTTEGRKQADSLQRVKVATYEADAVKGENESRAQIADYHATLAEREADAKRRGEVAAANAAKDVLIAEKEQEMARLDKEIIAREMIERKQVEIDAEAQAERTRRIARGEADAILAKYQAEAAGIQAVLEAKAKGYENLLKICGPDKELAPTLLVVEKLPQLIAEQVKAISNVKIDKITVWDSGSSNGDGTGSTANFLRSLIGSLPPMHELAKQAGVDLPTYLGTVLEGRAPVRRVDEHAGAKDHAEPPHPERPAPKRHDPR